MLVAVVSPDNVVGPQELRVHPSNWTFPGGFVAASQVKYPRSCGSTVKNEQLFNRQVVALPTILIPVNVEEVVKVPWSNLGFLFGCVFSLLRVN